MTDVLRLDDVGCDVYTVTVPVGGFREIPASCDYIGCLESTQDAFSLSLNGAQFFYFAKGLSLTPPETVIRPRIRNDGAAALTVKLIMGRGRFADARLNVVGGSVLPVNHESDTWIQSAFAADDGTIAGGGSIVAGTTRSLVWSSMDRDAYLMARSITLDGAGPTNQAAWMSIENNAATSAVMALAVRDLGRTAFDDRPIRVPAGSGVYVRSDGSQTGYYTYSIVMRPA